MSATHTPTPWKYARSHEDFDGPMYELDPEEKAPPIKRIYGANKETVVSCHDLAEISEANAELIVRAVNEREELLELLLKALPCVEESEQFDKPTTRNLSKRIREIVEANS